MNVLLVTLKYNELNIRESFPILALGYLVQYAKKTPVIKDKVNFEIKIFDVREHVDYIVDYIHTHKPDVLGFSCYVWNIDKVLHICEIIHNIFPDIKIILGGPEVSARSESIIKENDHIFAVVRNEGEISFANLLSYFLTGTPNIKEINGITFKKDNEVIRNEGDDLIRDLNTIPSVFLNNPFSITDWENSVIALETYRGCPYKCRYCFYHKNFSGIRYFSLDRVEEELKYLLKKKTKVIYLMDPTFNFNIERAKTILKIFEANNINSKLHVELRAELLDEELVALLKNCRVCQMEIGLQSTNAVAETFMNRKLNKKKFEHGISLLKKYKISYELQLISCLPGDNLNTSKDNINFSISLAPIKLDYFHLQLLPGTYFQIHAEDFGFKYIKRPPWNVYGNSTFSYDDITELDKIIKVIEILYNSHLLRNLIIVLQKYYSVEPSVFFDKWLEYIQSTTYLKHYFMVKSRYVIHKDIGEKALPKIIYKLIPEFIEQKVLVKNKISTKLINELIQFDKMRFYKRIGHNIPDKLINEKYLKIRNEIDGTLTKVAS